MNQRLNLKSIIFAAALCTFSAVASADSATAARGVIQRFIGERASEFQFEQIPAAEGGLDVYQISAADGKVTVKGSTTIAMTRGAYEYLRQACHCIDTWSGRHVDLPATFPDFPATRVVCPFHWRQQYNVCTFGYTTAFWNWDDWQRELDWLALHGFNMAQAPVGSEAIWQQVWLDMGLSQSEIDAYFTGPAYLPWFRMGNIISWDGPQPHSWNQKQVILQKKILARMRELGIQPIAPAFAGFVPAALARVHPGLKLHKLAWGGFASKYGASVLDSNSDLFTVIGKKYIQAWEKEFGPAKYFLADSFNEMQVPVPANRQKRLATLARYGQAVYNSIIAGDPHAIWVMQGWLFYSAEKFWDPGSVKALLSKVPNDRMIILDLADDRKEIWKTRDAFYGKQWIYSILHNMGGKTALGGRLAFFASDPAAALASPKHGQLVGFGLAPEGIENNDVVYELLSDVGWSTGPIDLDKWVPNYCLDRYGADPAPIKQAWKLLRQSCYANPVWHTRAGYQWTPSLRFHKDGRPNDSEQFHQAVKLFLSAGDQMKSSKLYQADAIELTAQYLGNRIDSALMSAIAAQKASDSKQRDHFAAEALALMNETDALVARHPLDRLNRWVAKARSWGDTPAEKDHYEADAKRLITTWGGHINDYASKAWSGMIRSYYRTRWKMFFDHLATGAPDNVAAWEETWITTPDAAGQPQKIADVIADAQRLFAKGEALQKEIDSIHRIKESANTPAR